MTARKQRPVEPPTLRPGATVVTVDNSGLEVWLYDEAHRERIVESGAMGDLSDASLAPLFAEGLLAAYSLLQDDALHVAVIVGDALTADELAIAPWLEPQRAFLALPSGELCIESSDSARILPEGGDETGGRVRVTPGRYRLTLWRMDHEALGRAGRSRNGPEELVGIGNSIGVR